MSASTSFDVAIIGASLAGSSLALHLKDKNLSIALIDKANFPRRKPCGEGLSNLGLKQLKVLGLESELLSLPHSPLYGYSIWKQERRYNFSTDGSITGVGIQRFLIDELLVQKAVICPAIKSFFGQAVHGVRRTASGFTVTTNQSTIQARFLVLANGSNSALSLRLGVPRRRGRTERYALSWSLDGNFELPLQQVHIIVGKDTEIFCTPTSATSLNVALLGNKRAVARASRDRMGKEVMSQVREKLAFEARAIPAPLATGPFAKASQQSKDSSLLLIGDCLETFDPIGGMGMTHALLSSAHAARALTEMAQQRRPNYAQESEKAARPLRGFTRLTYSSLKDLGPYAFRALARTPLPRCVSSTTGENPSRLGRLIVTAAGYWK